MLLEVQAAKEFVAIGESALAAAGILAGDFTELDIGDGNFCTCSHTAEVEDYHHGLISLIRGDGLVLVGNGFKCGEGHIVVVEESVVVVVVGIGNFNGCGAVGGRLHGSEEGVLLFRVCRDIGHKLYLALPLCAANFCGNGEGNLAAFKCKLRVKASGPVCRAEPMLLEVQAAEEVVAIGVTAFTAGVVNRFVSTLNIGDDELPCNGTAVISGRSEPYQSYGLGREFLDKEAGILDKVVVGDVREQGAGLEGQVQVLTFHLKLEFGGLLLGGGLVVCGCIALRVYVRRHCYADVHKHGSGLAGIEGVVSVSGEGESVVIHAEGRLVVLGSLPPAGGILHGFTAGHMGFREAVNVPGALGKDGEILVEVDDGVVNVEAFLHVVGRNAGSVHYLHANRVVAGRSEDSLVSVAALDILPGALGILEHPHRDNAGAFHGKGYLVGFLVYRDYGLVGCGLGDIAL